MTTNVTTSLQDTEVLRATTIINTFVPWVLVLGGGVCNILAILGMRTSKFRSLSTSVFMIVASVNDLFSLVILLVAHWVHLNFPDSIDRGKTGTNLCKFFNFYGWGQADLGIILMSGMTADRAYAILRPMTTVDLVKRAKIVTASCIGVVVLKEFHFLFTSVVVAADRKDRLCDVDYNTTAYRQFYVYYWPWIDLTFIIACFIVIVASNTVIINHVRKNRNGRELPSFRETRKKSDAGMTDDVRDVLGEEGLQSPRPLRRSDSTMTIHGGREYEKVGRQVTRMLLAESVAFIVLSLPFSVHLVVAAMLQYYQPDQDAETKEVNALAFSVVFYLLFANKCVNFLVYCLAGKRFRKAILTEVLPLQRCRKWCGGSSDDGPRVGRMKREVDSDGSFGTRTQRLDTERGQAVDTDTAANATANHKDNTIPVTMINLAYK